jgi:NAD(P)-dependent dehydrogenase (short-subunit alcohol dehydrogenase family)
MIATDQFRGQVVLLVGAATGMGHATAEAFAGLGATVIMGDVNPDVGRAFEALAGRHPGLSGFGTHLDVTDEASCRAAVERTVSEFGCIDVLANFAGVIQQAAPVDELPVEEWDRVMGVNLRGHFLMARAAVPQLKAQRSGRVILVTSIWSHEGFDLFSAYCASKGGLKLFMHALAKELVGYGVNVNAVAPGIIDTELHRTAVRDEAAARGLPEDVVRAKEWGKIPTGRAGDPEDVAHAVVYLASREARYVVGATLDVNGLILVH